MVKNAFTDILFNWQRMSREQKRVALQELENTNAKFQGRKPRRIIVRKNPKFILEHIGEDRSPSAYYVREDENNIYVVNLDCEPIEAIKSTIHEGIHAYIHDFISGKVQTLKLYSPINLERFYIEEENLPAIADEISKRDMLQIFDSYYIEERVNYQENTYYIMKLILDSIRSSDDIMKFSTAFMIALSYAGENEIRGKTYESRFGITYDDIVIDALNREFNEKVEVVKTGKVQQIGDPEFIELFKKSNRNFMEYLTARDSLLISEELKNQLVTTALNNIYESYKKYSVSMLNRKIKQ